MKNKLFIAIGVGIVLILLIFSLVVSYSHTPPAPNSVSSSSVPSLLLDNQQEQEIKSFVQNFVSLYNSYSSDDVSNITALGDYETIDLQERTQTYVEQLQQNTPAGVVIRTEADAGDFSYQYPEGNTLLVSMGATATRTDSSGTQTTQKITASLTLKLSSQGWLADDIQLTNK